MASTLKTVDVMPDDVTEAGCVVITGVDVAADDTSPGPQASKSKTGKATANENTRRDKGCEGMTDMEHSFLDILKE